MTWNPDPIARWLLTEGRLLPDLNQVITGLGQRLDKAGAPVWRVRLGMRTVHPLVAALSSTWERDGGDAEGQTSTHGLEERSEYKGSPIARIAQSDGALRWDLRTLPAAEHQALHDMRAKGGTDYFGIRLPFATGGAGIAIFVSDHEPGFTDADIAGLKIIADTLTPIAEIQRLQILSSAVSEAYLGRLTAQRVLGGQITRGHIERLNAAILVSDIRGWTALNTRLPPEQAVARANAYFELMSATITDHGGEILKFLGDGILAIFPADGDMTTACKRALTAAQSALAGTAQLDVTFGIGLHMGEVLYGNIGAETRLDFTVLGQAVNIAARIEALCKDRDTPLLMSGDLAAQVDGPTRALDPAMLKGLDHPMAIHTV